MNFSPFLLFLVVVSGALKRIFFSFQSERSGFYFICLNMTGFFLWAEILQVECSFPLAFEKIFFGTLYGGNNNLTTDRQLSTRTAPDLKSFVVDKIQTSATLSQSDKESLLQDFFNLLYRNGAMGGLLKDLFGINDPAPEPSKVFDMLIKT